jgi:putative membrane protein
MTQDRAPKVFRLDDTPAQQRADVAVTETPDVYAAEAQRTLALDAAPERKRSFTWARVFWSAASSLVVLAIALWLERLLGDLYAANPVLGYVGLALAVLALVALVVMGAREFMAVRRLNQVFGLREEAQAAYDLDDMPRARRVVARLMSFSLVTPQWASARGEMAVVSNNILDGADLLRVAERVLVAPRDVLVKQAIATASKRVSVITAISPRAIVDVLFVLAQSVRLVRRIAEIYGGRPSTFGFLRLARAVLGHLAVTGGVAIGDSVASQLLGAGLAARLSAKLGEGVLNGVLTARVGIAAIAVCRPLPFLGEPAPTIRDVAGSLFGDGQDGAAKTAG